MRAVLIFTMLLSGSGYADDLPHAKTPGSAQPSNLPKAAKNTLQEFLDSLGGKYPKTPKEFRKAFDAYFGPAVSFIAPFSLAPGHTNLKEPRVVFLSPRGDLKVALIAKADGTFDAEFIAFNRGTRRNDFGRLENFGKPTMNPKVVDRNDCVTCHKTNDAIFPAIPWVGIVHHRPLLADDPTAVDIAFLRAHRDAIDEGPAKVDDAIKVLLEGGTAEPKQLHLHGADVFAVPSAIEQIVQAGNLFTALSEVIHKAPAKVRSKILNALLVATLCAEDTSLYGLELTRLLPKEVVRQRYVENPSFLAEVALTDRFGDLVPPPKAAEEERAKKVLALADWVTALSAKKQETGSRNASPTSSPLRRGAFVAESTTLDGRNSYSDLELKTVADRYAALMALPFPKTREFCESAEFNALVSGPHLPDRVDLMAAVDRWKKSLSEKREKLGQKACADCHLKNAQSDLNAPFDLGSLADWQEHLTAKDEKVRKAAEKWRAGTLRALKKGTMPPEPHKLHLSDVEKNALIQFLEK